MPEKIKKNTLISDIKEGDQIEDIFFVKFKKPLQKYSKGYWFEIRLEDTSDGIMLKYWGSNNQEEVQKAYDSIQKDAIILLKCRAAKYRDKIDLITNNPTDFRMLLPNEFDEKEFKRYTTKNMEEMSTELKQLIEQVQDNEIKSVLTEIFITDTDFFEKFQKAPAAVYLHHAWIGGLIEHTLNITKICLLMKKIYPQLNQDYLIAGALLHDIGKPREFSDKIRTVVSQEGMLVGHISIGVQILSEKMKKLNIPQEKQNRLIHLILSHHSKQEFGSPKTPAFLEAFVVALADELDARTQLITEKIEKANTEEETIYTKEFGNIFLK
ncbi:HD domain-containing protein [Candidatus Micrarchaeota archaeon]|nr:HD domain-containing protein [Candidatus Micrarchaeota archaeon]MBU1930188.1 HD domain-containing protein [Candidatus Micrarchaeota archaeon]